MIVNAIKIFPKKKSEEQQNIKKKDTSISSQFLNSGK